MYHECVICGSPDGTYWADLEDTLLENNAYCKVCIDRVFKLMGYDTKAPVKGEIQ